MSFISLSGTRNLLDNAALPCRRASAKAQGREKIIRYVNLCTYLRRKLGIKDTCLSYSLLLCQVLRREGIEARINFGAQKKTRHESEKLPFIGHCWVSVNDEELKAPYALIFRYP
jgi:hypothetical protein